MIKWCNLKGAGLVFLIPIVLISGGCKSKGQEPARENKEILPIVKWKTVEAKDIKERLNFVGDILGEDEAVAYSKVPGKLLEKKVSEGDAIKKDDVIATVNRDEVGYTFEPAPVLSPLDGLVGRIYLDRGDKVTPTTPVARIVRIDSARIKIDVVERYIPLIKKGQVAEVTVDAYQDEIFKGTVSTISPVVEEATRTAVVEVTLLNADHRLMPGMFAKVSIVTDERKGVPVIPNDSILTENNKSFVFVLTDEKAYKRPVTLGIREDNLLEVKEGLSAGEKIIVYGQYGIEDGTLVKSEEMQ